MKNKLLIFGLFFMAFVFQTFAQRIVVDTASTNKYLITPPSKEQQSQVSEDPSFSDRAMSIGVGILNRLKARLNLEEAAESIKDKKQKILGKDQEEEKQGDG